MKKIKIETLSDKIKADLKSSKNYIIFILVLFLLSTLVGVAAADLLKDLINPVLEEMISKTENLNTIELIMFIFFNNSFTSLGAILFGIIAGIMPLVTTVTNGVVLGYVIERVSQVTGLGELWRLFPHGIFELPAVFISIALGLKIGIQPLANYLKYYRKKTRFMNFLPFFIALVLSLLAISTMLTINAGKNIKLDIPENFIIPFMSIAAIIFYFAITSIIFILFTAIKDKKLRKIQVSSIKENFRSSIRLFAFLIVPLLFVAAIIEGILIFILP